jgi:hypothetical protein
MSRKRKLAVAGALLAVAAVIGALATRTGASENGSLARISNEGRTLTLRRGEIAHRLDVRHAALLAIRDRRAFYLLDTATGQCAAAGRADEIGHVAGAECPRGPFPSASQPVVDLSIYEGITRGRREVALYRAEGVAADGVAAIAFLRPNGAVALEVPVRANVFSASSVPSGAIAGLAALSADGSELWRSLR